MVTRGPIHDRLAGLLPECGARAIEQAGPCLWKLTFANGAVRRAVAAGDGNWLTLEAKLPADRRRSADPQSLWTCLEYNWGLPAGAKFVLTSKDRCPRIRVDVPLDEGTCSAEAIRRAGHALRAAFHCLGKAAQAEPCATAGQDRTEAHARVCDLEEICTSSGWAVARRAAGALSVRLESRGGTHHASLAPRAQGVSAAVHLAACDALGAGPYQALAILLLTASGLVRMVRATAERQEDGRTAVGFEVMLDTPPTAQQLGCGLSAVSVACGLCGPREIAALQEEGLARRYLAIRGWAPNRRPQEPSIRKGPNR